MFCYNAYELVKITTRKEPWRKYDCLVDTHARGYFPKGGDSSWNVLGHATRLHEDLLLLLCPAWLLCWQNWKLEEPRNERQFEVRDLELSVESLVRSHSVRLDGAEVFVSILSLIMQIHHSFGLIIAYVTVCIEDGRDDKSSLNSLFWKKLFSFQSRCAALLIIDKSHLVEIVVVYETVKANRILCTARPVIISSDEWSVSFLSVS